MVRVAVIGAGKMGLPLACQFASKGARVIACDRNTQLVEAINAGRSPFDEPGVAAVLAEAVAAGRLQATTDIAAGLARSEVVVVIVPALLTPEQEVDLSILRAVSEQIAASLRPRMMVSYETTVPVGATRHELLPILERSGLRAGEDFDLVFSPERVKSQLVLRNLSVNPKIVGALTPQGAERATAFYHRFLGAPVINAGSLEAAELAKLAGMVYRDVNIALANELARYAETVNLDFTSLIDTINTDGEAALLRPGVGVGGHCTPVYPYFFIHEARRVGAPAALAETSRQINEQQPARVLDRLEREWGPLGGVPVRILGLGFRPQVKEHINSPAFALREELVRRRARATLHDPYYSAEEIAGHGFVAAETVDAPGATVLVLNTAHREYLNLDFAALAANGVAILVDGRNAWNPALVAAAGLAYLGVGRPYLAPGKAPRPATGAASGERWRE